jgi:hypothetical protein
MPNTTNYSFPTPADTDLVKNGADAIRDLGDAVDTAMNTALGTKKAMGVLLSTVSFSGVASVSLPADTFTTTYDDYKIIFKVESSSTSGFLTIRFRASGVDATGSDYNYAGVGWQSGSAAENAQNQATNIGLFFGHYTTLNTFTKTMSEITVFNPKLTEFTSTIGLTSSSVSVGGTGRLATINTAGLHKLATAYDSATFIASAGNITGSASVFGVNK